ncbi:MULTISPECIES: hypothetical protein [Actinomycetes]|uniref:hypothetical protein n=1 Tax=Actinomycetes TaxID=1760 RepID=UPI002647D1D6|nr:MULTISPECIES: hypothetical protein [Actinomycetes]MDN5973546.1 hypothetical protein [Bifidobacterium crudilactis]MDN6001717.1 hypothetical protein [Bifidobacterium crudilactis]MDN6210311.1 hypothetical protein [Bifidobacterium crudilactis]MDN6457803.1 hypothetical protein [Yaniella sp.]MDN6468299.1 hypothetical protein [Bifidobacterium crudilactis]
MKNPLRATVSSLIEHRKEQVAAVPVRNDTSLGFLEDELTRDLHRIRNASDAVLNDILHKWSPERGIDSRKEASLIQFLTVPHDIIHTTWEDEIIISCEYLTILVNNSPNPVFNVMLILTSANGSGQRCNIARLEAGETTDTTAHDVITYNTDTMKVPINDATQGFVVFSDVYGNTWWNARTISDTTPMDDTMQEKINALTTKLRESHEFPPIIELIESLMDAPSKDE